VVHPLIVLVSAFDALGLQGSRRCWNNCCCGPEPSALVILVLAGLAADALAGLIRGATAEAKLGNPEVLATIARVEVGATCGASRS
jgi:hypothetical protein